MEACEPFGSLVMLPECFYCPPGGDSGKPSDEYIKKAQQKAGRISGAEDCMGSVYEWGMEDPNWDRLDYEQPFRKFHLPGAGFSPTSAWKRLLWTWLGVGQRMIE